MDNNNVIAVVDIGSTKVCAMIGRVYPDGKLKVEGEGCVSCRGVKKMVYQDPEAITTSIKRALVQAQEKANIIVSSVYVNIGGAYLNYIQREFEQSYGGQEKEFDTSDILQLIRQASKMQVYEDESIVDVIPVGYVIDGDTEVSDPCGLVGTSITMKANVVIGHADMVRIICKCVQKIGLIVDGVIPAATPIAWSQLRKPERNGTTLILDVGGKITEYILLKDGVVVLDSCLATGGDSITNDIAKGLDVSLADAESLKRDLGYASVETFRQNKDCYVTHAGTGESEMIRAAYIIGIIQTRVISILEKVRIKLEEKGVTAEKLDHIVIVGEGMRSLDGLDLLVHSIFGIDGRRPDFFVETGYMPTYLTAYSIMSYILSCISLGRTYSVSTIKKTETGSGIGGELKGVKKYMSMLKEFFTLNE